MRSSRVAQRCGAPTLSLRVASGWTCSVNWALFSIQCLFYLFFTLVLSFLKLCYLLRELDNLTLQCNNILTGPLNLFSLECLPKLLIASIFTGSFSLLRPHSIEDFAVILVLFLALYILMCTFQMLLRIFAFLIE